VGGMRHAAVGSLLALVLAAPAVAAQTADVCASFKKGDIAALVGPDASEGAAIIPGSCSWNAPGKNLTITRARIVEPSEGRQLVDAVKSGGQPGETVKDEPGLGDRAASRADANGRTLTLVAVSGTVVWNATLSAGDLKLDVAAALPRMRELVKAAMAVR
jgi:hypothetical protein